MNRKILITGGTGFIGSRVIENIIKNKDIPILFKRSYSDTWRIKDFIDKLIYYDIDKTSLEEIFKKEDIDAIINLAAHYIKKHTYEDIENLIETNIKFPTKLLNLCENYNVKLFINAGSFFQYDKNCQLINENTSLISRNLYAATKTSLEKIMEYYASKRKFNVFNLILFTPYGEKDNDKKLIPYVIKQAISNKTVYLTDGFQKLNLVYIEDIASAFINALNAQLNDISFFTRINIADKRLYSIREIVTIISQLLDKNINVNYGALKIAEIDIDKILSVDINFAEKILGWHPNYDIYNGLRKTVDYYLGEINEY